MSPSPSPRSSALRPLAARGSRPLRGVALVAGDKSISHRALILGALAVGQTRITGLLEAEDVLNTAEAMRAFGATVTRDGPGTWRVDGVGVGGFAAWPLVSAGRSVGVVSVATRTAFEQGTLEALATAAELIGAGIERVRAIDALRRSEARLRLLVEASSVLSSSLDYEQTLASVAKAVSNAVTTLPASAYSRERAERKMVSPSGIAARLR